MAKKVRLNRCLICILAAFSMGTCLAESTDMTVSGRIMSNGQPVQGEIIVVDLSRGVRVTTYRSDSLGVFQFQTAPGTRTLVVAKADGCISAERELNRAGGGHVNLNFALSPAGSVSGRVIDEVGTALAGAVVRVRYPAVQRLYQFADELGESITDEFGYFTLPYVAEDKPFTVEAETADRLPSTSPVFTFERASASGVLITLGRKGQVVRGRVFSAAGSPLGGISIRMRCVPEAGEFSPEERTSISFASRSIKRTTTGPDGSYEFRGIPAGRVIVVASRPGAKPVKEEGISEPGVPLEIDLILQ